MLNFLVPKAYAQPVDIGQTFGPAQHFSKVSDLVNILLPNIFTVAGVLMLVAVVAYGFKVVSHAGSGEAEQLSKDRAGFTAAIIGLIIIVAAYFIIQIISFVTGFNILHPNI